MSHEKSITVFEYGRYFVLDNSGSNAGKILGPEEGFETEEEANKYAQDRSNSFGQRPPKKQR